MPPIWECFGVSPSDWLCVRGVASVHAALDPQLNGVPRHSGSKSLSEELCM